MRQRITHGFMPALISSLLLASVLLLSSFLSGCDAQLTPDAAEPTATAKTERLSPATENTPASAPASETTPEYSAASQAEATPVPADYTTLPSVGAAVPPDTSYDDKADTYSSDNIDEHNGGNEYGSAEDEMNDKPSAYALLNSFFENAPDSVKIEDIPPDTAQLVVVEDAGGMVNIYLFEKAFDDSWTEHEDMRTSGWCGTRGITEFKEEGDQSTPAGLFRIGEAFYIDDVPQTGLEMFEITEDTYWVDDPNSLFYNLRVEGTGEKDWNSAEHMINYYSSYKYGFVIKYNTERVPGAGSAIFFHIGSGGTAGCIAVSENYMLYLLRILENQQNPYILII